MVVLVGCSGVSSPGTRTFSFDLSSSDTSGWVPGVSDYPEGRTADLAFDAGPAPLPQPLSGTALHLAAINISDDAFLFYERRISGLEPNRIYHVTFDLGFASGAGQDCLGGGASLYLKAGATQFRPDTVIRDGFVELNIDKGNQAIGGSDATLLGRAIHDGSGCGWGTGTLQSSGTGVMVRSDTQGRAWLLTGAESAFEGATELYFTKVTAAFTPG